MMGKKNFFVLYNGLDFDLRVCCFFFRFLFLCCRGVSGGFELWSLFLLFDFRILCGRRNVGCIVGFR